MSTRIEVRVPDLGSFKDVAVIELLVKVGDEVEVDTPLVTLETEKATMDVPSTAAGRVESIAIAKGGVVNAGDLVLVLAAGAGAAAPAATIAPPPAGAAPPATPAAPAQANPEPEAAPDATVPVRVLRMPPPAAAQAPASIPGGRTDLAPIDEPGFSRAHASPSVRRFARELGVDLARVTGSGAKGRILHDDVKGWVKQALAGGGAGGPAAGLAAGAVGGARRCRACRSSISRPSARSKRGH
jgi:pyruvate dehydrogenase E2 component (dihydrolipoamide acetyltransferase)